MNKKRQTLGKLITLALLLILCTWQGANRVEARSNYEPYSFTTLAGNAPGTADGTGSAARFNFCQGVAVDSAGNIYAADYHNHTVRKITPEGSVSTLAGLAGMGGSDDGTGSAARFSAAAGIAVDSAGNVYVADSVNNSVRKITPAGVVSTLADGFDYPYGVAVDNAGNVYVANLFDYNIRKITPGGVVTTLAGLRNSPGFSDGTGEGAEFNEPASVAVDATGNVYVADSANDIIRKITPAGVVTTLAGLAESRGSADGSGSDARFNFPIGVAVDGAGYVYVADQLNSTIRKITPAGVVSTLAGLAGVAGSADGTGSDARFRNPQGVAIDSAGNVYVGDGFNNTIRKITPAGVVSTIAGLASIGSADGAGSAARFDYPPSVAVDAAGNVYVADGGHVPYFEISGNNTIRKITPDGVVSALAGLAGAGGASDGTGSDARFLDPQGIAVDFAGNVYVADSGNNTIRKITAAGVVSTLAGLAGASGTADGAGSDARFFAPSGVTVDIAGNIYVADSANGSIRKITPAGLVTTLAGISAQFREPASVAVDSAGNVYVADSYNHTIRKISPAGVVSTFAGLALTAGSADGTGSAARFKYPGGVAVDTADNVYVADVSNDTIRKITPAGVVTTLGGLALKGGSTDGTGDMARFNFPGGVAVDNAGAVYVADSYNNTIRVGKPSAAPTPTSTPVISISVSPAQVNEGGDATFTVTASTVNPSQPITIGYSLSGKAHLGIDYSVDGAPNQFVIPAGQSSASITLHALTDSLSEKGEKVTLKLSSGAGYKLSSRKKATVTIINAP